MILALYERQMLAGSPVEIVLDNASRGLRVGSLILKEF